MRARRRVTQAAAVLLVAGTFLAAPPATAQLLTGAVLLAAADKLVSDLKSLVTTVSVEGQKTIGSASTVINGVENQLRQDIGTDLGVPIRSLGSNIQNTANTLSYVVDRVNDLLTKQRGCLDLDINLFEAGLQTTIAQAKLGIPFVSAGGPRLNQFTFAGHTPNVIPLTGGPVTLSGFKLWTDRAPGVTLVTHPDDQAAIATLAASRQSDNDIIVDIPTAVLQTYSGQCLFVRIVPRHPAFLGLGTSDDPPVSMPFCVPDTALTEYQTSGTISYFCPSQTTSTITTDWQHQENASCENEASISANFGVSVPPNCRIIGAEPVRGSLSRREIGSTSAAIAGQTVVLTSRLDQANCANVAFIHSKIHNSDWQYAVKATLQCDSPAPNEANVRSAWTVAGRPETDMCVDLPKSCAPVGNITDVTVKVFRYIRGGSSADIASASIAARAAQTTIPGNPNVAPVPLGSRPLSTPISGANLVPSAPQIGISIYDKKGSGAAGSTLQLPLTNYGSTTTVADYTPGVSSAPARACATVKVAACGY